MMATVCTILAACILLASFALPVGLVMVILVLTEIEYHRGSEDVEWY